MSELTARRDGTRLRTQPSFVLLKFAYVTRVHAVSVQARSAVVIIPSRGLPGHKGTASNFSL